MKKLALCLILLSSVSTAFANEIACIKKIKKIGVFITETSYEMKALEAVVNKNKKKNSYSINVVTDLRDGKFVNGFNISVDNSKSCDIQKITQFGF